MTTGTSLNQDILGDLLDLVSTPFEALDGITETQQNRARLLRAEPELLQSMGNQMVKVRDHLADTVTERLNRVAPASATAEDARTHAEMIVELKTAIMKTALFTWGRSSQTFASARSRAYVAAQTIMSGSSVSG